MDIASVHEYLADTLLPTVEIADGTKIKRAYRFMPPADKALADIPCAMLPGYELTNTFFRSAFIEQHFGIHLQVFVARSAAAQDRGAAKATEFLNALAQKFSAAQRLGGTVSVIRGFRSNPYSTGQGALTGLAWAGVEFVALDLMLDVTLKTTAEHAA